MLQVACSMNSDTVHMFKTSDNRWRTADVYLTLGYGLFGGHTASAILCDKGRRAAWAVASDLRVPVLVEQVAALGACSFGCFLQCAC
jgi:hypothetical protein